MRLLILLSNINHTALYRITGVDEECADGTDLTESDCGSTNVIEFLNSQAPSNAVLVANKFKYKYSVSWDNNNFGCFVNGGTGEVYFNLDVNGKFTHPSRRSICKTGAHINSTQFIE